MEKKILLNDYYMVSLNSINKNLLRAGQKVYLNDTFPASCVKLHPQILKYLGCVGKLKKNGDEYSANWVEIEFDKEEITVCDSYLDVMFEY